MCAPDAAEVAAASRRPSFDAASPGDTYEVTHTVAEEDVAKFRDLSGDTNPLHWDAEYARSTGYRDRVVYGGLAMAYISRLLGTHFPGPGVVWLSQELRFLEPLYVGDRIIVRARVERKSVALRTVTIAVQIAKQSHTTAAVSGDVVLEMGREVRHGGASPLLACGRAMLSVSGTYASGQSESRVAVITGGARGIGAAIAERLADHGIRVIVGYRANRPAADAVVDRIRRSGGNALAVQADVTARQVDALCRCAEEEFGPVTIVVNNAGPAIARRAVAEVTADDLRATFDAYAVSALELVQAALPRMREAAFGRIVNIVTTAAAGAPPPGWAAYVAAKSALISLSRSWATELACFGITSNVVSPSLVNTDRWSELPEAQLRAAALRNPTKRLTTPADVAHTVAYLVSPEAQQVNGAHITVSGGETML